MNKIITLVFTLLLTGVNLFGQAKLDYNNDSRWFWGLNAGGTWQTTDVRNQFDKGFGFVIGKSFNYDYGKHISIDLRARYLYGHWQGQDVDTTGFKYKNTALSQGATNYLDSMGFAVLNFQTVVHRISMEMVLHANGIRERTGWDPYIFGGAGITFYQTMGNQLSSDSTSGNGMYAYDKLPDYKIATLRGIQDNSYETALDGTSKGTWNPALMASIGFGLGYQLGPRFSMGLEHKTTFTGLDNFDGYKNPTSSRKNDLYHYTSIYMRFQVRKHNATVVTDPVVQQAPEVIFTNPASSGTTVSDPNYTIRAVVKYVNGRDNINFRQNGIYNGNFSYNASTDLFESQVMLQPGQNVFEIIASNAYGTDQKSTVVIYRMPQEAPPVVTFTNPASNPQNTSSPVFNLTATVFNVQNASQVSMNVNGQAIMDFTFSPFNGNLSKTINLTIGTNVVTITGTNSVGTDSKTTTIIYNPVNNVQPPVVYFTDPNTSPYSTANGVFNLLAKVMNVGGRENISFKQNGNSNLNFTYNANTDDFQSSVVLVPGQNVFEIIASNSAGVGQASTIIIYERTAPKPPVVTITNPSASPYNTENNFFSLSATVLNVMYQSQVQVTLNGQNLSSFVFTANTNNVSAMLNLVEGTNTVMVKGTNDDGVDWKQVTIIYKKPLTIQPPVVTFTNPSVSPYVSEVQSIKITANVLNVDNNSGINVNVNGNNFTGFSFNPVSKNLSFQLTLLEGANVIVVTGTNAVGTDSKSTTIIYKRPEVVMPPVVTFVDPLINPLTVFNQSYELKARVQHVAGAQNIALKINGTSSNSFVYSGSTELMTFNSTLLVGANIFEVTATNSAGQDSKTTTIIYKQSEPLLPPVVTITVPEANPYTTGFSSTPVQATILNIDNAQNIQVLINNVSFGGFTFSNVTKTLTLTMDLNEGSNSLVIKAINAAGNGMDSRTVIYKKEVVLNPPLVTFINPGQPGLTVSNSSYEVQASVLNIENATQIIVSKDGQVVNPGMYSYNLSTKKLTFNTGLSTGNNIFTIQATNASGTHSATTNIIYKAEVVPCDKPVITFLLPNASGQEIAQSNNAVKLKVLNVSSGNQIQVLLNGVPQNPGSFNPSGKIYDLTVNYTLGQNIIEVIATNDCGETRASTIVVYKNAGQPCQAPAIQLINPTQQTVIVEDASIEIKASVLNITDQTQLILKLNGVATTYTYDLSSHVLLAKLDLADGLNNIEIQASNDCGSTSSDLKITKTSCVTPKITITSSSVPNNSSSILENFSIEGNVLGISLASQFSIIRNGVSCNYIYDVSQKTFSLSNTLVIGVNTFVIKARSNCGVDMVTFTVTRIADPTAVPPVIQITNPATTPYATTVGAFNVQATTQHVTAASQVSMNVNGNPVNANYNTGNGSLTYNLTLVEGNNVITVSAVNQYGSSTDTKTIVYTKAVVVEKPVIVLQKPNACPATLPAGINQIKGHILNITDLNQVSIKLNGENVSNFNPVLINGKLNFQFEVNMSANYNNIELLITAQNQGGSDSKSCLLQMAVVVPVESCIPTVGATFSEDSKSVTVTSTKEITNVVVKFFDGNTQKVVSITGMSGTLSGTGNNTGKCIIGVWIKSGCNQSADGPGYGVWVPNNQVSTSCSNTGTGTGDPNACMPVVTGTFAADSKSVAVTSTKSLNNVVLKFFDGSVQKIANISGLSGTFNGTGNNTGKCIIGVWIKAGCNLSNDGPGYGEYVANNQVNSSCTATTSGGGGTETACLPTVSAVFSTDNKSVVATSTKVLSNVVLKYFDGQEQKFNNLSGMSVTLQGTGANAGKCIIGVWIKSGCNQSADGPNYGEWVANTHTMTDCTATGNGNNGHGNNDDGIDESNPGQGGGGPNGQTGGTEDDESGKGGGNGGGTGGGNKSKASGTGTKPTGTGTNGTGTGTKATGGGGTGTGTKAGGGTGTGTRTGGGTENKNKATNPAGVTPVTTPATKPAIGTKGGGR